MRIVYALSSDGVDAYAAMTLVSATSARLSQPSAAVCLVTDDHTDAVLRRSGHGLLREIDEQIVMKTPPLGQKYRSRYLKTQIPRELDGSFITLDCDTIVRGDLSGLRDLSVDVAAAPNHSADEYERQKWGPDSDLARSMDWSFDPNVYFNCGVVFWGDTPARRRFGERWQAYWEGSCRKLQVHRDQPAFNAAVQAMKPRTATLPHAFNAQFRVEPAVAASALVWHYYGSNDAFPETSFERLVKEVQRDGKLDRRKVESVMRQAQP